MVGRFPYPVVCYCATCKRRWAWGDNEFLGFEFTCPEQKAHKHLARLVLDEPPAFWWLQVEWFLYLWQTRFSPGALLNRALRYARCKCEAEHHVLLWFVAIALALASESQYGRPYASFSCPLVLAVLMWRLADLVLVNVSITFTSKFPANRLRTVALTLAGYSQLILVFAYLYARMGKSWFPKYEAVREAVYFSFGTIVTVGYGNLEARDLLPRFAVVSELMLGLFFFVIVFAQVAAWANQPQHSAGEFSLDRVSLKP